MQQKLKDLLVLTGNFLWKYKFTILFSAFLIFVSIILTGKFRVLHITSLLSFICLIVFLAKTKYTAPLVVLFSLLISVDAFFALVHKSRLTIGLMASILDTNSGEVEGVIKSMLLQGSFILAGILLMVYLSMRELKKTPLSKNLAISFFAIYWFAFVPIYGYFKTRSEERFWDIESKFAQPYMIFNSTGFRFPLIYSNLMALYVCLDNVNEFSAYANADRKVPEGITYQEGSYTPEKIYLVMGESVHRRHMSLYGAEKRTTPFMDSLNSIQSSPLAYYDGVAGATMTRDVFQLAFSFATPRHFKEFKESRNLLEMMKLGGYTTLWISNQLRIGRYETPVSAISSTADYSFHEPNTYPDDLALTEKVRERLIKDEKQFFVLHLQGSHMSYDRGYDEIDRLAIAGPDSELMHYDRTIHHTDRFMRDLYYMALKEGSDFLIIYVSDHGEEIGRGHGFMTDKGTESMDIPFVTINHSQSPIDSIVEKYIDKELNIINNTNTINVVLETAGFVTEDKYVEDAIEEGKYIFMPDKTVRLYESLME